MNKINTLPLNADLEEYNELRIMQSGNTNDKYRNLTANEIELLKLQKNRCHDWSKILVTDLFQPLQVKNCYFWGTIRIDDMEPLALEFHELILPVGLYDSQIRSCDIGKNCSISDVGNLSRVIIGNNVILKDINELVSSDHAKFGNGIVKNGEDPAGRIELEIANEAGGREILPFTKMLTPDAFIWYKYRDNKKLMSRLREMVDQEYKPDRGFYSKIGDRTIIKNCRIIKDVRIESDAYIKGCNKLKNLTIMSTPEHPTQIGEGCILVNGIVSPGCKIFYSAVAVRFQLMPHSSLKYGARLLNSVLGENSTISCCEVLNSFIFPGHEQHHNSSFLIASVLQGQTNIASGATVGSNHNSRANDGEIVAGRGFWPGLNASLKHDSYFSSFNIIVKGGYKAEINNPLPFTLISLNRKGNVEVYPAYWFVHNMYALKRNSWKYGARDKRGENFPYYDFNFLAPDTVDEMIKGRNFLEYCAEYSFRKISSDSIEGYELLENYEDYGNFSIYSTTIENKNPGVRIHKPAAAYREYKDMIILYGVSVILEYCSNGGDIKDITSGNLKYPDKWKNCGGQFIPEERLNVIIEEICDSTINNWEDLHERYKQCANLYPRDRAENAYYALKTVLNLTNLDSDSWLNAIEEAKTTRIRIKDRVFTSREKDFKDKFRSITFDSLDEKEAVIGKLEDNKFFDIENRECSQFIETANRKDLRNLF